MLLLSILTLHSLALRCLSLPRTPACSQAQKSHAIGRSKHSSVSFTLQDSDVGDMFDVAIYKDPVFGTPVFKTLSGRSKCPHETDTVSREKIGISFDGGFKFEEVSIDLGRDSKKTILFELSSLSVTGDSGATKLTMSGLNANTKMLHPLQFNIIGTGNLLVPATFSGITPGTFALEPSCLLCFIGAHFLLTCSFPMMRCSPGNSTLML